MRPVAPSIAAVRARMMARMLSAPSGAAVPWPPRHTWRNSGPVRWPAADKLAAHRMQFFALLHLLVCSFTAAASLASSRARLSVIGRPPSLMSVYVSENARPD